MISKFTENRSELRIVGRNVCQEREVIVGAEHLQKRIDVPGFDVLLRGLAE